MVTAVRGSDVGPIALTRTETLASADDAQTASTAVARRIFFTEPPLSTRAYGPVGRRRSPGSRAYRRRAFPAAVVGVPVARARTRCGRRPRSQWRVRAGFTPASLTTDPER